MPSPLFSTYSQDENRVTASILAVFERLSFSLVEEILQALMQEPEAQLLSFSNQPPGPRSVPDARISASFSYWLEVKRIPHAVRLDQIQRHLEALDAERSVETKRLLVLTPDAGKPETLVGLADTRVAWANFADLLNAISSTLETREEWFASQRHIPTERERELLRELARFLVSEGLTGPSAEQVLVVAARTAWPQYQRVGAYICQPNRTFRPTSHMAFYADGAIKSIVPAIVEQIGSVMLTQEEIASRGDLSDETKRRLLKVLAKLSNGSSDRIGEEHGVILLTEPDCGRTMRLTRDITNDCTSASGQTVAFVQGQRYVPLSALLSQPATTSELITRSHDGRSGSVD